MRETILLTEDSYTGTLVRVRAGSVTARMRSASLIVRAGGSYFAEAPCYGADG